MTDVTSDCIADLVDSFYEAAYDERKWSAAMVGLRTLLSGSSVVLGFYDSRTNQSTVVHGDCGESYGELFFEPALKNHFLPAMQEAAQGQVFTDTNLMPKDEFLRTALYNEWFVPQGEHSSVCAKVVQTGDISGHLVVQRGGRQPEFDAHDIALVQRITPIVARAAMLRQRIGALRLEEEASTYEKLKVGFAVVDASARLVRLNGVAETMLASPTKGLQVSNKFVAASEPAKDVRLRKLIERASGKTSISLIDGGEISLNSPITGAPALAISVVPVSDGQLYGLPMTRGAALFMHDLAVRVLPGFEDRMRALFGLTKREAELTAALAAGLSLQEAAEHSLISTPTARTHLAQVFRKTHTSQQSQLVSLVLGMGPAHRRM